MSKNVHVQIDLQFQIDPRIAVHSTGDLSTSAALRLAKEIREAAVREVADTVASVLCGSGDPSALHGYARIEGAIERRVVFGELCEDWLGKEATE